MRLKSAYRAKPAEQPSNIPEPSEKISVEVHDEADPEAAAIEPPQPVGEATQSLLRQLQHLRQSEQAQRQHAQQMAPRQQPMTRVQFLQSQGLTKVEAEFFDSREDMMANQQQASEAAAEALAAGIERDSPEFFQAVEEGFAKRVEALNQRAAEQPAPAFFQPTEPPPWPAPPHKSSLYSAPVSREAPSGGTGQRPARQIKLTAQEQEYARIAGVSDVEYARQKQRLALEKAAGERQQ